jgi:hypothetical protein
MKNNLKLKNENQFFGFLKEYPLLPLEAKICNFSRQ